MFQYFGVAIADEYKINRVIMDLSGAKSIECAGGPVVRGLCYCFGVGKVAGI